MPTGYVINNPADLKSERSVTGRGSFLVGTHVLPHPTAPIYYGENRGQGSRLTREQIENMLAYNKWAAEKGYRRTGKSLLDRVDQGVSAVVTVAVAAGIGYGAGAVAGFWGGAPAAASPAVAAPVAGGTGSAAGGFGTTAGFVAAPAAALPSALPASGFALGLKTAAGVVASVGSIAGSVGAIRGAGMSAEAGAPAYAAQISDARQPTRRSVVTAPAAAKDSSLLGAGLLALLFVVLT